MNMNNNAHLNFQSQSACKAVMEKFDNLKNSRSVTIFFDDKLRDYLILKQALRLTALRSIQPITKDGIEARKILADLKRHLSTLRVLK